MRTTKNPHLVPLENAECLVFVEWLEYQKNLGNVLRFSHISNETPAAQIIGRKPNGAPIWKKNHGTTGRLHALGVRPGVPDYLIVTGASHLVFIEMKRVRGSSTSAEQREWIAALDSCQPSVHAAICKGAEAAIEFVEKFLPAKK